MGGDWYDAVRTPDGRLALVVGDVMGRGVRAATTMIRVRAGIRGLLTVDPAPQAVLTAADEMMARDAPDQFVTAAAVLVDPATGTRHRCATPATSLSVVVHPDGRTEVLAAAGPASRWACRATASAPVVITRTCEPGALLVLVTDGVVESRTARPRPGHQAAARARRRPAGRRRSTELVTALAALADTSLHDDVTVRGGPAEVARRTRPVMRFGANPHAGGVQDCGLWPIRMPEGSGTAVRAQSTSPEPWLGVEGSVGQEALAPEGALGPGPVELPVRRPGLRFGAGG